MRIPASASAATRCWPRTGSARNCSRPPRLAPIAAARPAPGAGKIGERKVIGKYKMAKHFTWSIDDEGIFTYGRDAAAIAAEAQLDGLYVIRLPQSELDGPGTVRTYKRLSSVERTFRSLKTVDLKVRPVYHRPESAPTSSCACSPTTSNGTCARD